MAELQALVHRHLDSTHCFSCRFPGSWLKACLPPSSESRTGQMLSSFTQGTWTHLAATKSTRCFLSPVCSQRPAARIHTHDLQTDFPHEAAYSGQSHTPHTPSSTQRCSPVAQGCWSREACPTAWMLLAFIAGTDAMLAVRVVADVNVTAFLASLLVS